MKLNRMLSSCALAFSVAATAANAAPAVSNDNRAEGNIQYYKADIAQLHPAEQLVREVADGMLVVMKNNQDELKKNPDLIYDLLEKNVLLHFDFEKMSRIVLGQHWRRATDDQKKRFTAEFRTLVVRTYANALLAYSGQKIDYLPLRGASADEAHVRTKVKQNSGPPISVDYDLSPGQDGRWRVYNLTIEGISLVESFRGEYSEIIRNSGGIDSLIDMLAAKNRSLKPAPR